MMNLFRRLYAGAGGDPIPLICGRPRSSKWEKVRKAHLIAEPLCQVCLSPDDLEVHHVEPYHVRPDLELDFNNLLTMCRDCHLTVGHLGSWSRWNENVRTVARLCRFGRKP